MKFKLFMILLAIVGLIAVSLFLGYLIGMNQPKKEPINPLFFSDAGKQVALLTEKTTNKEKEKTPKAVAEGTEKQEKKEEAPKKNDQKKETPKAEKKEAKEESPKKEEKKDSKEEGEREGMPEEKKELELPAVEDPKALGEKLRNFYQTGHLDQEKKKGNKLNQKRLKLFYMRGYNVEEKRLESLSLWSQGDRNHNAPGNMEDAQYTSLEKLNEPFEVKHVRQGLDLPEKPTKKQYADALNKIIVDPWYSRVHY